jgi:uncharacterized protein
VIKGKQEGTSMPYIYPSTYKAPLLCGNNHFQTIYHSEFRRVDGITYNREKIFTPDGDFLNIDWLRNDKKSVVLILHGLESSADRPYMKGMVKALVLRGFDCAVLNLRGCGGEINKTPAFYHAGKTEDIETAVLHLQSKGYTSICLVGFSLGGNIVLKYLGERGKKALKYIARAAAVSAPCDLHSSSNSLEKITNKIYNKRFVKKLVRKIKAKMVLYPGMATDQYFRYVKTLRDFDDYYTAPMIGYSGANEYYTRESSLPLLSEIAVPTLLINAKDDPFLGKGCFPVEQSERSSALFFEAPERGGHIGFYTKPTNKEFWHETRVADFLGKVLADR